MKEATNIISATYEKIASVVSQPPSLRVNFSVLNKGGKFRYTIRAHIFCAGMIISESESGWNLLFVLRKVLHTLEQSLHRNLGKKKKPAG